MITSPILPPPTTAPPHHILNYSAHLAALTNTIKQMKISWLLQAKTMQTMPYHQVNNTQESLPLSCIKHDVATKPLTASALDPMLHHIWYITHNNFFWYPLHSYRSQFGEFNKVYPYQKCVPLPEELHPYWKISLSRERVFTLCLKSTLCMSTFLVAQNSFHVESTGRGFQSWT